MIFVYNANGELLNKVPEKVYQGSNKANTVYFFAPFSSVSLVDLSFALPNGELRPKRLMTRVEDFTATELKIGTENLTCWAYDLNQAVTTYAGEVTLQFFVTNGGETVATNPAVFTVEKGVPPIEPDADIDTYENVISSVSALIDVMGQDIVDYIDQSEEKIIEKTNAVNVRINEVNENIGAVNTRIDEVNENIDKVNGDIANIDKKVSDNSGEIDRLSEDISGALLKLSTVYTYKGSVLLKEDLPTQNLTIGDVYNVEYTGTNYAWTGTEWDSLGGIADIITDKTLTLENVPADAGKVGREINLLAERVGEALIGLSEKQDVLTAGKYISIKNNVISLDIDTAEGGSY